MEGVSSLATMWSWIITSLLTQQATTCLKHGSAKRTLTTVGTIFPICESMKYSSSRATIRDLGTRKVSCTRVLTTLLPSPTPFHGKVSKPASLRFGSSRNFDRDQSKERNNVYPGATFRSRRNQATQKSILSTWRHQAMGGV